MNDYERWIRNWRRRERLKNLIAYVVAWVLLVAGSGVFLLGLYIIVVFLLASNG